jgi:hypothetical protein
MRTARAAWLNGGLLRTTNGGRGTVTGQWQDGRGEYGEEPPAWTDGLFRDGGRDERGGGQVYGAPGQQEYQPVEQGFGGGHDYRDGRYDDEDDGYWEQQDPLPTRGGGRRSKRRRALIIGGSLGGVGIVVVAVALLLSSSNSLGSTDSGPPPPAALGITPSDTDPAQAEEQTARAFLTAWQSGDVSGAARITDSPAAATAALTAYRDDLHLSKLSVTEKPQNTDYSIPFEVAATVSVTPAAGSNAAPAIGTWTYSSYLTAHLGATGTWVVIWQPGILAPNLTAQSHLVAVTVPPGAGQVTDSGSTALSSYTDPGLRTIAGKLAARAPSGQGTPGIQVQIVNDDGSASGVGPATVSSPTATGRVATTIDPTVENAAERAVSTYSASSMVVLRPSTGAILGIASNDGQNDDALTARIAPGSTMKVVTSAALLNGGLTPQSAVACPQSFTVTGVTIGNSDNESRPAGTPLIDDFAASCNNAFTTKYQQLSGGVLAQTAANYFGLNQKWDIGLGDPQPYFTMPSGAVNSELAEEAFGQGQLAASPLAMASVAATVDTGVFHQPILVQGAAQVSAGALPGSTDSGLKQMMRAVVSYSDGTAHGVGFGSGVYAKTGTADHGVSGAAPNSWMIAFDPGKDIAVGCVVLDGGFGATSAGTEVASLLASI